MEIRHVENFPPELEAVAFERHHPSLAQGHIQTGVAISTDHIAGTTLPGERMLKIGKGRGRIGENADGAIRLSEMSGARPRDQLGDALLVPVGGPEVAVIYSEGEAAGPASQAGKLPASDQRFGGAR